MMFSISLVLLLGLTMQATFAEPVANVTIAVFPENKTIEVGGSFTVTCKVNEPLIYCRMFSLGGPIMKGLNSITGHEDNREVRVALARGECKVEFSDVNYMNWQDGVGCELYTLHDEAYYARTELFVMHQPEDPSLSITPEWTFHRDGEEIFADCRLHDGGGPPANITWWLDDEQIIEGVGDQIRQFLEIRSNLTLAVSTADNGRVLQCRVEHMLLEQPKVAKTQLSVIASSSPVSLNYSSNQVTVIPKEAIKNVNESFTMLCQVGHAIDMCRISIAGRVYRLHPNNSYDEYWSETRDIMYYGNGLENGECGVHVRKIEEDSRGNVSCLVPSRSGTAELRGDMQLIIPHAPSFVSLESIQPQGWLRIKVSEGETYTVQCTVAHSSPPANITWLVDSEPVDSGLSELIIMTNPKTKLHTVQQNLTKTMSTKGLRDGVEVICAAKHSGSVYPPGSELGKSLWISVDYNVTIEPKYAHIHLDEEQKILCKAFHPIQDCSFTFEDDVPKRLIPGRIDRDLEYFGNGLESGECGIYIKRAFNYRGGGKVTCYLTLANSSITVGADMRLDVTDPPYVNVLVSEPDAGRMLTEGDVLNATCKAVMFPPVPKITWWIDDVQITSQSNHTESSGLVEAPQYFDGYYLHHLNHTLTADEYGRHLWCRVEQDTWQAQDSFKFRIRMKYPVKVQPKETITRIGEKASILCSVKYPLDSCRIVLGDTSYRLSEHDQDGEVIYQGKGLQSGECGAIISNVREEWFGEVRCVLPPPPRGPPVEVEGTMLLWQPRAPTLPTKYMLRQPTPFLYTGDRIYIMCIADGIPAPKINLFLGDRRLIGTYEKTRETAFDGTVVEVARVSHYAIKATAEYDGMEVKCRVDHEAIPESIVVKNTLNVMYRPQLVGPSTFQLTPLAPAWVNVTVKANPEPLWEWEWEFGKNRSFLFPLVHDHSPDKWAIFAPSVPLGNNMYNCSLYIPSVDDNHIGTSNLTVWNRPGTEHFAIKIKYK